MRLSIAITLALVACSGSQGDQLLAAGAGERPFTGQVALSSYDGLLDNPGMYAVEETSGQGRFGWVGVDGRFSLTLLAGGSYELLLVNSGRNQQLSVVSRVSWTSGAFSRWARVISGQSASLGVVRPLGVLLKGADIHPLHDGLPDNGGPSDAGTAPPPATDASSGPVADASCAPGSCGPPVGLCSNGAIIQSLCDSADDAIEPRFEPATSDDAGNEQPCPNNKRGSPTDACGCTGLGASCDVNADCAPGLKCFGSRCSVP
jgi:hypothetical protein